MHEGRPRTALAAMHSTLPPRFFAAANSSFRIHPSSFCTGFSFPSAATSESAMNVGDVRSNGFADGSGSLHAPEAVRCWPRHSRELLGRWMRSRGSACPRPAPGPTFNAPLVQVERSKITTDTSAVGTLASVNQALGKPAGDGPYGMRTTTRFRPKTANAARRLTRRWPTCWMANAACFAREVRQRNHARHAVRLRAMSAAAAGSPQSLGQPGLAALLLVGRDRGSAWTWPRTAKRNWKPTCAALRRCGSRVWKFPSTILNTRGNWPSCARGASMRKSNACKPITSCAACWACRPKTPTGVSGPARRWPWSSSRIDVEEAVNTGLAMRPELLGLRQLTNSVNEDTLPAIADGAAKHQRPAGNQTVRRPGLPGTLAGQALQPSDMEVPLRRQQLYPIHV